MKLIKILIAVAVVVTACVLVWNIMWMQEMDNKYDVNQLREEARQLSGKKNNLISKVPAETERAVPVKEEVLQVKPHVSEKEPVEKTLQENEEDVRDDVADRLETVAEKKPKQIIQREQEVDFDEPVDDAETLGKDASQLKPDPTQPRIITIKGPPGSKAASNIPIVTKQINNISTPVSQHPTGTSP